MKRFIFTICLALLSFNFSHAQTNNAIDSELQAILGQRSSEMIDVTIVLKSQINPAKLKAKAEKTRGKSSQRDVIVKELKEFSDETQSDIMSILEAEVRNGNVSDIRSLWIANAINCKASKDVIYLLSTHPDIKMLTYDKEIQLISKEEMAEISEMQSSRAGLPVAHVVTINADHVWDLGYTGKNVIVAVLDSGTNYMHHDLKDHLWEGYADIDGDGEDEIINGWNFIADNENITDDFGHGTHCAGIVCGDGTSGQTTGVAPDATLMTVKTVGRAGGGTVAQMLSGVQFAVDNGADILSMSLGFKNYQITTEQKELIRETFDNVLNVGVIVCAAAGNDGNSYGAPDNIDYPAACPSPWKHPDQVISGGLSSVVCVGANDLIGQSSQGPATWQDTKYNEYPYDGSSNMGLTRPDISAPGNMVYSLNNLYNDKYKQMSGTSQATPCVAGVMALMLEKNSSLTPAQITEIIETTAADKPATKNNVVGSGRVDALAAVNAVEEGTRAPFITFQSCTPEIMTQGNDKTLDILVKNEGKGSSLTTTTATLSLENDPYVTLVNTIDTLGQISTGYTRTASYTVNVDSQTPNGHVANFTLVITSGTYSWKYLFSVTVSATPNVVFHSVTPGVINVDEDTEITVTMINNGTADMPDDTKLVLMTLPSNTGIIDIISDEATIGPLGMGETTTAKFTINADKSITHNKSIDFFISTVSESDVATSYTYGFETDIEGWTSFDAAGNDVSTPWWHSSEATIHSKLPKSSNSGNGHVMSETVEKSLYQYPNPIDNYLVSPQKFKITDNSILSFYARAHHDNYYPEHFGVAVSTNGNTSASDFTMIQEWTIEKAQGTTWTKYTVDLSQYSGQEIYVAIRHFFTKEMWEDSKLADFGYGVDVLNIDDIALSGVSATTQHTPTFDDTDPNHFTITINNMVDLDAPQNLTATVISETEIDLSWNTVAEATAYNIYRDGVRIATVATGNTWQDINLKHNTEYCYDVAAVYYGTEFEHAQVCATTKQYELSIDVTDHSPETIYMGVNDGTLTITIINDGAKNFPARGYYTLACDDQYVSIGTESYLLYPANFTPGTMVTEKFNFTIDTSIPNNYKLTFYARFDSGGTQESEYYNFAVPIEIIVKNDPNIPRNLRVVDYNDNSITWEWDPVDNAIYYNIYRDGVYIGSVSSVTYQDLGLSDNTTYCYSVSSVTGAGESEQCMQVCQTTDMSEFDVIVQSCHMEDIIGRDMDLEVTLLNKRTEATPATSVATLSCDNPYVTIVDGTADLGTVDAGGTKDVTFVIRLDAATPLNEIIVFNVTASDDATGGQLKYLPYSFDNDMQGWTEIDNDGDGHTWYHSSKASEHGYGSNSNPYDYINANYGDDIPTGVEYLISDSYCNNGNKSLKPDDWLIMPVLVEATDSTVFNFYAGSKAKGNSYKAETFGVYVSIVNNKDVNQFRQVENDQTLDVDVKYWKKYSFDLSSYAGQKIWIAIRHNQKSAMAALAIDDIYVRNVKVEAKAKTSSFKVTANPSINIFTGTGSWSDAERWSKKIVPIPEHDVIISGDATIESGDITVHTITINDKDNVEKLTVNSGVILNVSSYFFNKNADAFLINDGAQIIQNNDNVAATYKMFIDNPTSWGYDHKGGWQYISSPVKNALVADFDPKTTDYDIFKYDGTQELEWVNVKNHATDFETTFQQGRGYIVSYEAETSAYFKGTLCHEKTFTFKDVKAFDAVDHFNNFYLLGNPFTFDMEWEKLSSVSGLYNGYVTMSNTDGSYDYHTSGTIKVGDGFLTIAINNGAPNVTYGGRGYNKKHESINITVSSLYGQDNTIINLAGQNNEGFLKLENINEDISEIYIEQDDSAYGIFNFDEDVEEVEVSFSAAKTGFHTISIEADGKFKEIILIDKLTGVETDMLNSSYTFKVLSTEERTDRFTVKFSKNISAENESFVYQSGEELIFNAEGHVQIIDVMGRIIYDNTIVNNRINISGFSNAVYIVRLSNEEGVKTQKIVTY